MLRVAKMAVQIAAAEAHKDGWRSSVVTLALQGVKYFVDFIHGLQDFGTSGLREGNSQSRSLAVPRHLIKVLRGVILDIGSLVIP